MQKYEYWSRFASCNHPIMQRLLWYYCWQCLYLVCYICVEIILNSCIIVRAGHLYHYALFLHLWVVKCGITFVVHLLLWLIQVLVRRVLFIVPHNIRWFFFLVGFGFRISMYFGIVFIYIFSFCLHFISLVSYIIDFSVIFLH